MVRRTLAIQVHEVEAVDEVLRHYSKRIRIVAIFEYGHIDKDTVDSIKQRLVTVLFQFRHDRQVT